MKLYTVKYQYVYRKKIHYKFRAFVVAESEEDALAKALKYRKVNSFEEVYGEGDLVIREQSDVYTY